MRRHTLYFFISGFHKLHTALTKTEKIRILVGIKTDWATRNRRSDHVKRGEHSCLAEVLTKADSHPNSRVILSLPKNLSCRHALLSPFRFCSSLGLSLCIAFVKLRPLGKAAINTTNGMNGDLQGIIGSAPPVVKTLECRRMAVTKIEVMSLTKQEKQVVSRQRVSDHGEVYTAKREVAAMLDLVKQETERIESRFLEPACGDGNFLTEILERKLRIVESRYGKSQLDYERNAVLAASSIYGIDILEDNVVECRQRLFEVFEQKYNSLFKEAATDDCRNAVKYILERNIIWGDALTLKTVSDNTKPIVFSEWSPVNGSQLKRRDFTFHGLLDHAAVSELPLFSDLGEDVFIPTPLKEYPLTHFLKVADVERH